MAKNSKNHKCRYCKKELAPKEGYSIIRGKTKVYFCNKEEYELWNSGCVAPEPKEQKQNNSNTVFKIMDYILDKDNSINGKKVIMYIKEQGYDIKSIEEILDEKKDYLKGQFKKKNIYREYNKCNYIKTVLISELSKPKTTPVVNIPTVSDTDTDTENKDKLINTINKLIKVDSHSRTTYIVTDLLNNYPYEEIIKAIEHEEDRIIQKRNYMRSQGRGDSSIIYTIRDIIEDRITEKKRIDEEFKKQEERQSMIWNEVDLDILNSFPTYEEKECPLSEEELRQINWEIQMTGVDSDQQLVEIMNILENN